MNTKPSKESRHQGVAWATTKQFAQALLNADTLARARGERFGLCDCADNEGNPYPSQWLADLLAYARETLNLKPENEQRVVHPRWSTKKQWE